MQDWNIRKAVRAGYCRTDNNRKNDKAGKWIVIIIITLYYKVDRRNTIQTLKS